MSEIKLSTPAEERAESAENLPAFSGLKLLHIKRKVAEIIGLIGRERIFHEYTKHDISHINYMLRSVEWLIPDSTKDIMSQADWLMIVLSIYFHDLGMLVTNEEYENRKDSHFPEFKKDVLDGKYGSDYKDKIQNLNIDDQDRFIYQELVRRTHAERIKYWILEEKNPLFKTDLPIIGEIKKLLGPIQPLFKEDLAMVCESHHLSDLDNLEKYKTNQPYGTSNDEEVNLQYAALILRTADLLHITSDRTPSVEYRLINPTDPISQEEWAKQRAVTRVRPKEKKNDEGKIDDSIPKDTLEVIAFFEEEKGFFGLISYINYAKAELRKNYEFNEITKKKYNAKHEYPWKNIDDSKIKAKDFEKKQFEFTLDQTRILDLLVGHTLYNDPTVVLRELTQNALDASKLKKYELEEQSKLGNYTPEIKVEWDKKERTLIFNDNGTGMSLEIIQKHLLKVGSSRYQEENFKKKYPDFSPISRFGIGLLTCFLIADDLDILTKSEDKDKAILLKIRKVHGKYLLKYLSSDKIDSFVKNHGTSIKLFVRSDVELSNIERDLKKWVLIPNCKLTLIDNGKKINVGFDSPYQVIEQYLADIGYKVDNKKYKIQEYKKDGVKMAFALRYVEHFKEWEFLDYPDTKRENLAPTGVCIEGIRVDFNTPGFNGKRLVSIANTTGKKAPKTNVASVIIN